MSEHNPRGRRPGPRRPGVGRHRPPGRPPARAGRPGAAPAGRPASARDAPADDGASVAADRLLTKAATLFAEHGYDGVGVRAIAETAGVSAAMVAYYFGNKHGLLLAVLERGTSRLLGFLETMAAELSTANANATPTTGRRKRAGTSAKTAGRRRKPAAFTDEPMLARCIQQYLAVLAAEPWLPRIIVREVISRDSPLRVRFVHQFAARAAAIAPLLLLADRAAGHLRTDLHPAQTLVSLLGMCVFPFIAVPVLGPLLGYRADAAFSETYARHVQSLFLDGARPRST